MSRNSHWEGSELPRKKADAPRKSPQQSRSRSTVDAILFATAHILKTQGFERAGTNRIAELAGVSIGSLYQYFPNKGAVIAALRERHDDWFDECLRAEIARIRALDLRAAARALVTLLVDLHLGDLPLHNQLARNVGRPIDVVAEAELRALIRAYLEEHRDALREMDLDLAAWIGVRTLEGLIHGAALDAPDRLREPGFVDELSLLLVRYLEP